MIDYRKLQKEHLQWSIDNFGPDMHPNRMILGLVEEIGELTDSLVKGDTFLTQDAVGDVFIYLMAFCETVDIEIADIVKYFGPVHEDLTPLGHVFGMFIGAGLLSHARLKSLQNIRVKEDHRITLMDGVGRIYKNLRGFCDKTYMNFEDILQETWKNVRQRDWKKNAANGLDA